MFEIYNNTDSRLEYIAGSVLENSVENKTILFMTDDYHRSVYTFYKLGEILGNRAKCCPLTLEIKVDETVLKFGVCRYDEEKDHYRFAGMVVSKLYFDAFAQFHITSVQYLMTIIRE